MEPSRLQTEKHKPVLSVRAAARSDTGLVRANNEDAVVLGDLATGKPEIVGRLGDAGILFGVCDGMGGEAAGEIASRIAAETVRQVMSFAHLDIDRQQLAKALGIAVELAGKAIREYAAEHPKCEGMGTTCTVAAVRRRSLVIAHVGDSRAYLLRRSTLRQLTRDHNLANELLARGRISREQVAQVVNGKHITQAVGNTEKLEVDLVSIELEDGDRVLVCSDGLTDLVDDTALAEVLGGYGGEQDFVADELVRRAKAAGGRDNVSLVVCEFRDALELLVFGQAATERHAVPRRRRAPWIAVAVAILAACVLNWFWVRAGIPIDTARPRADAAHSAREETSNGVPRPAEAHSEALELAPGEPEQTFVHTAAGTTSVLRRIPARRPPFRERKSRLGDPVPVRAPEPSKRNPF